MAKITFHEVGWKNFLSTGNTYNVVHLDKTSTTLLYGDSGSGKTTVADALCYALYKRPLRPINLPQLINSINNGECEVYAKFTVNGDLYKVTRGLKPAVFEIEVNGKPLDLASGREPQDWLESLLGMTFKTWKHVVSLGNASYTPFLQLAAKDRRELVEDLRDLDVFSSMQKLAKEEVSALNKTKAVLESDYKVLSSNATLLRSFISEAEKQSIDRKAEIQKDIDELVNKATSAKSAKDDLIDLGKLKSVEFVGYEETKVEYNAILKEKQNAEYKLNDLKSKINAVDDLTKCPTCYQEVTESHKTHIHTSGNAAIAKLEAGLAKIQPELDKLREACDNFAKIETNLKNLKQDITDITRNISGYKDQAEKYQSMIDKIDNSNASIDARRIELEEGNFKALTAADKVDELAAEIAILAECQTHLKDSGIKASLIGEFIPVFNALVNKYLDRLEFFVQLELDNEFNETIKSRHRDTFSYYSFSQGEKARLDIAILLAWRELTSLSGNSLTNIIILDEIADGSLDANAMELLLEILNEISSETNIFVISHRPMEEFSTFERFIEFKKLKNYSVMEEI